MATNQQLAAGARPVEGKQALLCRDGGLPRVSRRLRQRGNRATHPGTPARRAAKAQIADQATGIDQPFAQQLVEPVQERVLAQQPVGVRRIQRARNSPPGRTGSEHREIVPRQAPFFIPRR
jgi:hypothetical protein